MSIHVDDNFIAKTEPVEYEATAIGQKWIDAMDELKMVEKMNHENRRTKMVAKTENGRTKTTYQEVFPVTTKSSKTIFKSFHLAPTATRPIIL